MDESGNRIAGDFFFVAIGVKGDRDYIINELGLPGHWSSAAPCPKCPADKKVEAGGLSGKTSYLHFKPGMEWLRKTFETRQQFETHCRKWGENRCCCLNLAIRGG